MKKQFGSLRRKKGETLVETLISILIFTLGSVIMLTMISSAVRINHRAETADRTGQHQIADAQIARTPSGSGTIRITRNGEELASSKVDIFGGEIDEAGNRSFYTYFKSKEGNKP